MQNDSSRVDSANRKPEGCHKEIASATNLEDIDNARAESASRSPETSDHILNPTGNEDKDSSRADSVCRKPEGSKNEKLSPPPTSWGAVDEQPVLLFQSAT